MDSPKQGRCDSYESCCPLKFFQKKDIDTREIIINMGKDGIFMTLIKETAVEMIQQMPDDNMLYVINILQNLEAMSEDKEKDRQKARTVLENILSIERRLPEGFDPQKELNEAGMEKYGNIS